MTGSKVLLPIRVPELGPALGKLLSISKRRDGEDWLDPVRLRLVTRIFECAGEARRLAAGSERSAAVGAIGSAVWKQAWEEAVGSVAELVVARLEAHFQDEAAAVHMGRRGRSRLQFSSQEKRALAARLGAAGTELVRVLDELEDESEKALRATGLEPDAVRNWQKALEMTARRLEGAWYGLETKVKEEIEGGLSVADQIAEWRKPLWPLLVVGAAILPATSWLGLVLGGYVPTPDWLADLWRLVFSR